MDALLISLIQEAATWEGNLCLRLQPDSVPWIFHIVYDDVVFSDDEDEEDEDDEDYFDRTISFVTMRQSVVEELLTLLQALPQQNRKLHLILKDDFIQDLSIVQQILTCAAPSLIRIETNHPLLFEMLPDMALSCPHLRTLILDISPLSRPPHHLHGLTPLTTFLQHLTYELKGLSIHFSAPWRNMEEFLAHKEFLVVLADYVMQIHSLEALKLSGHLNSITDALATTNEWMSLASTNTSKNAKPSLRKLEIESTLLLLKVIMPNDERNVPWNSSRNTIFLSLDTLCHHVAFLASTSIIHLTMQVLNLDWILPEEGIDPSTVGWNPFQLKFVATSLTHLSLHVGLFTFRVDDLLLQLQHVTPNLEELDLQDNGMYNLKLTKFLLDSDQNHGLCNLRRLYLETFVFQYSPQTVWVERLLQKCPELEIVHRVVRSGALFWTGPDKEDKRMNLLRKHMSITVHPTPDVIVCKDWDRYGRYLLLLEQDHLCPNSWFPLLLEGVTQKFHEQQPLCEVNLLYLFVQTRAILGKSYFMRFLPMALTVFMYIPSCGFEHRPVAKFNSSGSANLRTNNYRPLVFSLAVLRLPKI